MASKTPTAKAPKTRLCYLVKIPSDLYEALDKARIANRHNKTAAIVTMAELYIAAQKPAKVSDAV